MTKKIIPNVSLFSDGGTKPNPGVGGYGIILKCNGIEKKFNQGYRFTTNNRMELLGIIIGLEKLDMKCYVKIYTDSKYVVDAINLGWALRWKSNNWYKDKERKSKALNIDLWERLLILMNKHKLMFKWVKGHNGHIENEECDRLASDAMSSNLIEDYGYMK